jgi:hypothetical protein
MPHDILMPQLGMAQDSAVIIAWLKEPGDAVAADDPLMEVETDKATMEVPAGKDGFLTEIMAAAGDEIPVGDVIAVISETADDVKVAPAAKAQATEPTPAPEKVAEPAVAAPEPAPVSKQVKKSNHPAHSPGSTSGGLGARVLASPKARMAAHQRGIDLQALARQGMAQPIRVADLDKSFEGGPSLSVLSATALGSALSSLLANNEEDPVLRRKIFAAFASGALRHATGWNETDIGIECNGLDGDVQWLTNPDRSGISGLSFEADSGRINISLFDLTSTRLTEFRPANSNSAQLSVANDGHGGYRLTLSFAEMVLPAETAAAFLDTFASRIEDPIRHIL